MAHGCPKTSTLPGLVPDEVSPLQKNQQGGLCLRAEKRHLSQSGTVQAESAKGELGWQSQVFSLSLPEDDKHLRSTAQSLAEIESWVGGLEDVGRVLVSQLCSPNVGFL